MLAADTSTKLDPRNDFQVLVAHYQQAIYRVAYRMAGNHDDTEDLIQESLLEAYQAFQQYRPGSRFDQWLFQIMTRNYIDRFRRKRKMPTVSLDEITEEHELSCLADSKDDPQDVIEMQHYSEPVQMALNRLSPEYRAVVVLCDVQELSYEEASLVLKIPVGTVRSRLHRAREQLRKCLKPVL